MPREQTVFLVRAIEATAFVAMTVFGLLWVVNPANNLYEALAAICGQVGLGVELWRRVSEKTGPTAPGPSAPDYRLPVALSVIVGAAWVVVRFVYMPQLQWWATIGVGILPLAFVVVFYTIPARAMAQRKNRLSQLQLPFTPGHFRLDPLPNSEADYARFRRDDDEHRRVAEWIRTSRTPFLYLTGGSGCGKSSIVNAYLPKELEAQGICLVVARAFADPFGEIGRQLLRPGFLWSKPGMVETDEPQEFIRRAGMRAQSNGKRLVLVLEQFEEVFALPSHRSPPVQAILDLLSAHAAQPVEGATFLLVLRQEYISQIPDIGLPPLVLRENWRDVPAFTLPAAQAFLTGGGVPADDAAGLVTQGSELDQIRGQVRPITLNMLGMVYTRDPETGTKLARQSGVHRGLLLQFLRARIQAGDWRDVAPLILRAMITRAGVREPPATPAEMAHRIGIQPAQARGGLLRLQQEGLVRPLGPEHWEVSHDFLAAQLNLALDQIERDPRRIILGLAPRAALIAWCIMLGVVMLLMSSEPHEAGELRLERLKSAFYEAKGSFGASKGSYVEFIAGWVTPDAVRYLHHAEEPPRYVIVNCIHCPAESVAEFGRIRSISVLHLAGGVHLDEQAVESLSDLPNIKVLTLILYVDDAAAILAKYLPRFQSLRNLQIGGAEVNNSLIETIVRMRNLETLGLRLHRIDDQGLEELHRKRPDLTIFSDNRHAFRGDKPEDLKILGPKKK